MSAVRAPFTRFQEDGGPDEVEEAARGRGLRRVIGELIICPYCLDMWFATLFAAGLLVVPRATRWIASVLAIAWAPDLVAVPAAGASPPPWRWGAVELAISASHHVAYAAAGEAAYRALTSGAPSHA